MSPGLTLMKFSETRYVSIQDSLDCLLFSNTMGKILNLSLEGRDLAQTLENVTEGL